MRDDLPSGLAGSLGSFGLAAGGSFGIIGGILGARKKREQEHRQKADAWAQIEPAYRQWRAGFSTPDIRALEKRRAKRKAANKARAITKSVRKR